jgi:phenylalanyl-tRNA synthetase beta chain
LKFSYRWIQEMVHGLEIEAPALERLLTIKTAECEGIEAVGTHFATAVAARVLTVEPLPKGRNKLVTLDSGDGGVHTVVCGAPNVRPGLVAVWLPPDTLFEGEVLSSKIFDGVVSEGMLASAKELGLGNDGDTLLELEGLKAGDRLPKLSPDWIIEIDNKSLTHRPDLWGHYGLAREVAAIAGGTLIDPVDFSALPQGPGHIRVNVADHSLCPRYAALCYDHVTVAASPGWLQFRLESLGLNPINNIVDITNLVLAELPQPTHAFDADTLSGDTIFVRLARKGESIKALNGETYSLSTADLVIADASGPIAIAGVIGGMDTAISLSTRRIVFESANFNAARVRLTSARLKLRTDASMRFEKSLDPENPIRGLARAAALMRQLDPGASPQGGVTDVRGTWPTVTPIETSVDFIVRKLGAPVTQSRIEQILTSLGFGVVSSPDGALSVQVPSWRATKDVSIPDDLVEEVGRIVGYDEIVPVAPLAACVPPPQLPMRAHLRRVRNQMAAQGFTEVYNYSFVNAAIAARFGFDVADHIAVKAPVAADLTHLRRSLLPEVFGNIVSNTRHYREFRLFEIGREIHPQPGPGLPLEITHLVGALYSALGDERDFYEMKRVAECVFPGAALRPAGAKAYEHPARAAILVWRGAAVGRLFELNPALLLEEGIEGRAILFDVDLDCTLPLASTAFQYSPIRKYPTSGFDLSVVADLHLHVATIESDLTAIGGESLARLEFVRQYAGPPLAEGQKSVSYHLEVGALDHTLTSDEVSATRNRIIDGMRARGYDLRV